MTDDEHENVDLTNECCPYCKTGIPFEFIVQVFDRMDKNRPEKYRKNPDANSVMHAGVKCCICDNMFALIFATGPLVAPKGNDRGLLVSAMPMNEATKFMDGLKERLARSDYAFDASDIARLSDECHRPNLDPSEN